MKITILTLRLFKVLPYCIILSFFVAYSILSIVRHTNYHSFGYDLGINDQVVWKYSQLQIPINTIHPFPTQTKFVSHIELIYFLLTPFYWIWSTRKMLLLVEIGFFCFSAIPAYLLAKQMKLPYVICVALLICYLGFYGVQHALWFNVHSISFGAGFLMWFIYLSEKRNYRWSILFFLLAIFSKENVALLTFAISCVFFWRKKEKKFLTFAAISILYLSFVFFVYFPIIVDKTYLYANSNGLLSNVNPLSMIDTQEKREVIWYALLSFGFLPLLSPLVLVPVLMDLAMYFVVASELPGAQGLYMHYRITLSPLLFWAAVVTLQKYHVLQKKIIAVYLLFCLAFIQYILHLPLSYLCKEWFWKEPASVKTITIIGEKYLSSNVSLVAQNNIVPHVNHRDEIYTLYPEKKNFVDSSPCGKKTCDWFRWFGNPKFLFVDTSSEWDARHLLINRENFIAGLQNLEKKRVISKYIISGTTILYIINKNPELIE